VSARCCHPSVPSPGTSDLAVFNVNISDFKKSPQKKTLIQTKIRLSGRATLQVRAAEIVSGLLGGAVWYFFLERLPDGVIAYVALFIRLFLTGCQKT
jgi:hypothetical protein